MHDSEKVLRKLDFQVPRSEVDAVVNCKPFAVEIVLKNLQLKVPCNIDQ